MSRNWHLRYTILCEDCGRETQAIRKFAKRCQLCRILSATQYHYGETRECVACEKEFSPLWKQKEDAFCADCMVRLKSWHSVEGDCAFCGQHSEFLLGEDVKVCHRCARDPEKRDTFIKSLRNKQQEITVK